MKDIEAGKMCIGATPFIKSTSSIESINYDESDLLQQNKRLPIIVPGILPVPRVIRHNGQTATIINRQAQNVITFVQ